ncbi:MAG TPA: hypothetical protein VF801_09150, partial [Rhodocyclaceae bacterium]
MTSPNPGHEDLQRYLHASNALEATRSQLSELEQSEAVGIYQKQLALLQRRLLSEPQAFRDMFISDGTQAVVWEFQQEELGAEFTKTLWKQLLKNDDMSLVLMRFI